MSHAGSNRTDPAASPSGAVVGRVEPSALVGERIVLSAGATGPLLLFVIGELRLGGQERQLFYLVRGLNQRGYRLAVVVWNFDERDPYVASIRSLGVPLYSLADSSSRGAKVMGLRHLVSALQPEVVHSYGFYTNFAAWLSVVGTHRVGVGSIRSSFREAVRDTGGLLGIMSAHWPRHQLCNSRSGAREIDKQRRWASPQKVSVVWNGVDLSRFAVDSKPEPGPVCVAGVGSLVRLKRWDCLIDAAKILRDEGLQFVVEIAGAGPLRPALEEAIRRNDLETQVVLLGEVADVTGLLARASLLVHTSEVEGCPNSVLEAMACGRAVIACRAGDVSEIVEHGKTGFVVEPNDTAGLVSSIRELILDPVRRREMGLAGRARVERDFQIDRMVDETLKAYRLAGWMGA